MLKNWELWAVPLASGLLLFVGGYSGRWVYEAIDRPSPDSTVWFLRVGVLLMTVGVSGVIACLIRDEVEKRQKKKTDNEQVQQQHQLAALSHEAQGWRFTLEVLQRNILESGIPNWPENLDNALEDWHKRAHVFVESHFGEGQAAIFRSDEGLSLPLREGQYGPLMTCFDGRIQRLNQLIDNLDHGNERNRTP